MAAPVSIVQQWDAALADAQKLGLLAKQEGTITVQSNTGRNILHKLAVLNSVNRIEAIVRAAEESNQVRLLVKAARQLDNEGKSPLRLAVEANCGNAARKILDIYSPDLKEIKALRKINPGMHIGPHHGVSSWWDDSSIKQVLSEALYQKSFLACLKDAKFEEAAKHLEGDGKQNLKDFQTADGNGPLSYALLSGNKHHVPEKEILKIVKRMIERDADVNQRNIHEESVLSTAVRLGYKTIVGYLLFTTAVRDKIDLFSRDKSGNMVVHLAASNPMVDANMLELLLKAEPGFINIQNAWGQTALHMVSDLAKAKVLLDYGANTQLRDEKRKIPLKSAIDDHRDAVAALLWKRDPRLSDGERTALRDKPDNIVLKTITLYSEKKKISKEDLQTIEGDTVFWNACRKLENSVLPAVRDTSAKIVDICMEAFKNRIKASSSNNNNNAISGS